MKRILTKYAPVIIAALIIVWVAAPGLLFRPGALPEIPALAWGLALIIPAGYTAWKVGNHG